MALGIGKSIVLVLDGFGVGEQPDAYLYGKRGANTLAHIAEMRAPLKIHNLVRMGISNLTYLKGHPREEEPIGFYGKITQRNEGNDSIAGHRELLGTYQEDKYLTYPNGLPSEIMAELVKAVGKPFLGNANDVQQGFLTKYGDIHLETGNPILLVTDDSLIHIYVHLDKFQPDEFYLLGHNAWEVLSKYGLGRLHVHYFVGDAAGFRIDDSSPKAMFQSPPQQPTLAVYAHNAGIPVHTIGKVSEMIEGAAITETKDVKSNAECLEVLHEIIREGEVNRYKQNIILATLPDLDALYGHNRDVIGYIDALEAFDQYLPRLFRAMENEDLLYIVSDHGNDPTAEDTCHTREYVPLLVYSRMFRPRRQANLGIRLTLADIAETIADSYDLNVHFAASSFWENMISQL
ncbi:MAG TPA: phosphopentomutase [Turneriella sp.]|nr:phosphopentomutase [Turneriella sp.]